MVWFFVVVGLSAGEVDITNFHPWTNGPQLWSNIKGSTTILLILVLATLATLYLVHKALGKPETLGQYFFLLLFLLLSKLLGTFDPFKQHGFGESVFCILLGFAFRNLLPGAYAAHYAKGLLSMEFIIKIGIVLLALNFEAVAVIGAKSLLVAWLETSAVLAGVYWIGRGVLRMDSPSAIVTSGGLSICGSSAAMAITDTIKSDKAQTRSLIAMMSLLTIPLIPVLPSVSLSMGLNSDTAGAWIGGCVDSTGAVSASAVLGGAEMLRTAILIKMLQNMLIGPVTLVISMWYYHSFKPLLLWEKFPKFVLGFILVGIITTVLPVGLRSRVLSNSFVASEWFSALSFVLIGMDINVRTLKEDFGNQLSMFVLYVIGQLIDIATTLGISYIAFTIIK
uniref:Sulfate exporter family transporter n=1 Tax=Arcella intermedia TaxID=1963864 RepID=A0A6B2L5S4_9EUKA